MLYKNWVYSGKQAGIPIPHRNRKGFTAVSRHTCIYDPVATTLRLFPKMSKKYNYVLYLKTIPEKPRKEETCCRLKSVRVMCFPDQLFEYTCKCTVFVEF